MENSSQAEDYRYDYSDYYNNEGLDSFLVCEKTYVQVFRRIFLPICHASVSVLSLVGNALLIFVLIRCTRLKSTVSVLLLNMAVSDLSFALTLPFWAVYAHSDWVFGALGCKVVTAVYTMNMYSGIFFITCLSLNAYFLIVRGSNVLQGPSRRLAMCTIVWAFSLLASVPSLVFVSLEEFQGQRLCIPSFGEGNISQRKLFMKLQLIICGFVAPFLAMTIFYTRIVCAMAKLTTGKRSKVLKLALLLVMVFFLLWFPYNVVLFLHCLQDLHMISSCTVSKNLDFAMQVTESLAFVHVCVNPMLYAFVNKRFRSHVANALKKLCLRGREYSLECTGNTSSFSVPNPGIELQTVQHL